VITTVRFTRYIMESDVDLFRRIGGDRMVGPLVVVVSPFQSTSQEKGGDRTTTFGAVVVGPPPSCCVPYHQIKKSQIFVVQYRYSLNTLSGD